MDVLEEQLLDSGIIDKILAFHSVMHDSDSGIGTDSGMIPYLAGIGIGIKNPIIHQSTSEDK